MIGVAGGLALTGLRPYRALLRAVPRRPGVRADQARPRPSGRRRGPGQRRRLVRPVGGGRTHQSPADVALLDTLDGWTVHVPGHADEVAAAAAGGGTRRRPGLPAAVHPAATPSRQRPDAGDCDVLRSGPRAPAAGDGGRADAGRRAGRRRRPGRRPSPTPTRRAPSTPPGCGRWPAARRRSWWSRTWPGPRAGVVGEALADRPHRLLALGVGRDGSAALRHGGRPRPRARAGRGRAARLDHRVPGR